jgi:N utilization substance protein B
VAAAGRDRPEDQRRRSGHFGGDAGTAGVHQRGPPAALRRAASVAPVSLPAAAGVQQAAARALDVLYEADVRGTSAVDTAAERVAQADPPIPAYAVQIVDGVTAHRARIDDLMATYAEEWTLDRMPAVDRNVLRIGIYQLLYEPDVPDAVTISEAAELAKSSRPTRRRASSTACSPACCSSSPPRRRDTAGQLLSAEVRPHS